MTTPDGKTLQVTDETLLPCRHGKQPRVCHDVPPTQWAVAAPCKLCGQTDWLPTREAAIATWNTRHQAQPIHAGPAMEAVMRSAAFKATKHQYDIHADEVERVAGAIYAKAAELNRPMAYVCALEYARAALLASRGDRLRDALVDAKNRLIAEGYLPDGEVCKNYDAILNRTALETPAKEGSGE